MLIKENERIDEVNDKLKLIQDISGLTFGTDALLLAGYIKGKYKNSVELGGGTGIISMLVLTREKVQKVTCVEIQESFCDLIGRNAEMNGLSDRLFVKQADVRELPRSGEYDMVFTNPPYMKTDSGRANITDKKNIARHEVAGNIDDFCSAASGLLRYGGTFYAVYRPDRLVDLICAMRSARIEPKRLTEVIADTLSSPSMVLVEGRRGGKGGMSLTPPLVIYSDGNHSEYSPDMKYILENGSFPTRFTKQ